MPRTRVGPLFRNQSKKAIVLMDAWINDCAKTCKCKKLYLFVFLSFSGSRCLSDGEARVLRALSIQ